MSLFIPAIWKAIDTRLTGDASLLTLLGSNGANNVRLAFPMPAVDPPGTTFPLVVFRFRSADVDDGFGTRRYNMTFDLDLYCEAKPLAGGTSWLTMAKIHERVIGDWPNQSSRTPTYGLDRWIPDFSAQTGDAATTYAPEAMCHTGTVDASDETDNYVKWVATFTIALDLRSA